MSPSRRAAFILAAAFAAFAVTARLLPPPRPPLPIATVNRPLPPTLGNGFVAGAPDETTPATRSTLTPGTQIATRTYRAPTGETVQVIRIVGSDRNALHDPRSCLAGVGWHIEDDRTETQNGIPVRVCRLTGDNRAPLLVAYGYVSENGVLFADPSAIRVRLLYQALVGGAAKPITFLRLITPDKPGQTQTTRKRLRSLAVGLIRDVATPNR